MLSDIAALVLAILGILFVLFALIFKLMIWKEKGVAITVPLNSDNREIYNRITNLREICSFLGIQKQCTIVIINYGASEWFIDELKECFAGYNFLKIIEAKNLIKELHT